MYNDGIREESTEHEVNKKIAEVFFKNEMALRKKHSFNRKSIAEYLGTSDVSVGNWERGKYVPANLDEIIKKVAELFDLDPGALVVEDFAERYDPTVLIEANKTAIEKAEEKLNDSVIESDKNVAIRYLTQEYEAAVSRYMALEQEIEALKSKVDGFKSALKVLGVDISD